MQIDLQNPLTLAFQRPAATQGLAQHIKALNHVDNYAQAQFVRAEEPSELHAPPQPSKAFIAPLDRNAV